MTPAPVNSTRESANSTITSAFRSRPRRKPPLTPLPESFSGSTILRRASCSAGASPKSSAVKTVRPRLNANTGRSNPISASFGIAPSGMKVTSALMPAYAKPQPTTVPPSPSSTLSTSSCRTTRHRLAPSAARIAISRSRAVDRAKSMFATLAQAISKSSATAAPSVNSVLRKGPTMLST